MATPEPPRRERYEITSLAGPRVAGRIVGDATFLMLTLEEAEYELREGTIVKAGGSAAPEPPPPAGG